MTTQEAITWILAQEMANIVKTPNAIFNVSITAYGGRFSFTAKEADLADGVLNIQEMVAKLAPVASE